MLIPILRLFTVMWLCCVFAGCESKQQSFLTDTQAFREHPTETAWLTLIRDHPQQLIHDLHIYHEARIARDLPNSMSRQPGELEIHLKEQEALAAVALGKLKQHDQQVLWLLLEGLIVQEFDSHFPATASELACRIDFDRAYRLFADLKTSEENRRACFVSQHRWGGDHGK